MAKSPASSKSAPAKGAPPKGSHAKAPAKPAPKGKPTPSKGKPPAPAGKKTPAATKSPAKGSAKPPAKAPHADKPGKPEPKSSKPAAKVEPKPAPKAADAKATAGKPLPKDQRSAAAPATTPAKGVRPEVAKAAETKAAAPAAAAAAPAGGAAGAAAQVGPDGKKIPPKGITIVANKPVRKPKLKPLVMPFSEPLLKPGAKWKPLITSGPKAPPSSGIPGELAPIEFKPDPKAKLPAKELAKYREILLKKRQELVGDMTNMEDEALRQNSGSLSNLPQHMAEQGSETFDQTLSLELAEVDRNLIKEIDEAIRRIDDGTYGICLRTGKRIGADRLAEIPWAKYSIEAAREMERRPYSSQAAAAEADED